MNMTPIFVTGAVLIALGAVYAGQLMHEASQCCLKRLRAPGDGEVPMDLVRNERRSERKEEVLVVSEDESKHRGRNVCGVVEKIGLLRANWQWSDANFIIEGGVTLGHWRRFIFDFAFMIGLQSDDFWNYIKEYDITIGQEQWFL